MERMAVMEQLELPFQYYDIHSDSMLPLTQDHLDQLEQVRWAYGEVRRACKLVVDGGMETVPVTILDIIHDEFRRRLHVTD